MPSLEEFMGKNEPAPVGMQLQVDVSCQICFEFVDDAEYFHIQKLLKWKCSHGHVSFIEDFRL